MKTRGLSHTVGLPITLKSILRQKKKTYYGNSKYFIMQKYNLQKHNPKETKVLLTYYNSVTNLKPKYHLSKNPHIKK
jgi:hypothetical protein